MKIPPVIDNLRSNYCKMVFIGSLVGGYFLIPKDVLLSAFASIAVPFVLIFALTMTCLVRTVREKITSVRAYGGTAVGLITSVIGISALQVCGIATPACGASVGIGIVSILFPGMLLRLLKEYNVTILIISMVAQLISLYSLSCFVGLHHKKLVQTKKEVK